MSTITAEDRAAMTESVRRLLASQNSEADVRRVMETPQGFDDALWAKLVELGDAWLASHKGADNALQRIVRGNVEASHRTLKVRDFNAAL